MKDAPRAWRKRLHEVLCGWSLNQLQAEPEIYVRRKAIKDTPKPKTDNSVVIQKIVETIGLEIVTTPNKFPKLDIILSAHVDDLKGGATPAVAKKFLEDLESHSGKCKQTIRRLLTRELSMKGNQMEPQVTKGFTLIH